MRCMAVSSILTNVTKHFVAYVTLLRIRAYIGLLLPFICCIFAKIHSILKIYSSFVKFNKLHFLASSLPLHYLN